MDYLNGPHSPAGQEVEGLLSDKLTSDAFEGFDGFKVYGDIFRQYVDIVFSLRGEAGCNKTIDGLSPLSLQKQLETLLLNHPDAYPRTPIMLGFWIEMLWAT